MPYSSAAQQSQFARSSSARKRSRRNHALERRVGRHRYLNGVHRCHRAVIGQALARAQYLSFSRRRPRSTFEAAPRSFCLPPAAALFASPTSSRSGGFSRDRTELRDRASLRRRLLAGLSSHRLHCPHLVSRFCRGRRSPRLRFHFAGLTVRALPASSLPRREARLCCRRHRPAVRGRGRPGAFLSDPPLLLPPAICGSQCGLPRYPWFVSARAARCRRGRPLRSRPRDSRGSHWASAILAGGKRRAIGRERTGPPASLEPRTIVDGKPSSRPLAQEISGEPQRLCPK